MPEGEINGQPYPIAIGDRGQTLWETTDARDLPDEVWEDWSLGLGETKRETGRGYFFSRGWDASERGALRLSPFYHNLNNTALTTDYGYFMEAVETSGSSLVFDATSTSKAAMTAGGTLTWSHTVASQSERLLMVGISTGFAGGTGGVASVTYDGLPLTFLGRQIKTGGTLDVTAQIWYLLDPPTGANNVVVTSSVSFTLATVVGANSWYGVNSDTPFGTLVGANGSDTTPTVTVTTAATEEIMDVVAVDGDRTMAEGASQTERWDASQTDGSNIIAGASSTQDGVNGGVMSWTITDDQWATLAVSIKPASTTSRSVMLIADTTNIFQYTYDSDTGLTLDATDTTASGVAGRPAKMNGNWYIGMGSGASAQKITGVTVADVSGTWNADHLSTFQKGVTPTLARVNSTTQNTVELNADTGAVGDNWTNESEKVGDTSTKVTDLLEAEGELFPCKEDGLYRYGSEAESFPIIPFIDRGKIDADNGKGSFAFGDEIIYMSEGDLWRKRIGRGALPVGLNTIRSWRKIDDIIDTPKDGRPAFGVRAGEYWYYLQNDGEVSHLIQARKRREGDPSGHELIQHSVLTIPLSKGLGKDSRNRLWIKGASTDETTRDIRVIELAEDGSLDVQNRRGQADEIHRIYFDERNPGRPQDKVQIRHVTADLEGDWDSMASLQLKLWLDNATSAINHGSAITAAGVTVRNPTTFGTSDSAFRFRVQLALTTNSSYTPKNSDPQVLRIIVGLRSAEIIRIVIPADKGNLPDGFTAIDVEQNLRRLQNQGTVTFRRPGDIATFTAAVFEVSDTMYATKDGFAHGIQIQARNFIAS